MDADAFQSSKRRRIKRKEVLEKKKAMDEIIRAASSTKDHLSSFSSFRRYDLHGLSVYLESGYGKQLSSPLKKYIQVLLKMIPGYGKQLSSPLKKYIQVLLKVNMEGPYGPEWAMEEKVKRRQMVAPEAQYLFARLSLNMASNESSLNTKEKISCAYWIGDGDPVVGFVQYRFVVEEEVPVLYVFELQLESCVRGKGLGKFLMQLVELIACKNRMGAVMLTVQKNNALAFSFYRNKLRYTISSISPSRVNPLVGAEETYEILCKTFNAEAKAKLEE